MKPLHFAVIVEGAGEVKAVPSLLARVARELCPDQQLVVDPVLRVPAARLVKEHELERQLEFASRQLRRQGAILVLLDCDDAGACPAVLGPQLLTRARRACGDMPVSVVLAKKEFEAWFLAAAESLRGHCGLPSDLAAPAQPEEIRGAKEWLAKRMPRGRGYSETVDQKALTAVFDMQAARRADSFDKCYREIVHLVNCLLPRT